MSKIIYLSILVIISSVGCSQEVATKIWVPPQSATTYPEHTDADIKTTFSNRKVKPTDFGIVFSGGGTRSASATLGQLQALDDLGWLNKASYISAVSGGAWASLPYTFLSDDYCKNPTQTIDGKTVNCDKTFLGTYTPPGRLTENLLRQSDKESMAGAISEAKFSFFKNNIYYQYLMLRLDESYAHYLGNIFLRPFKLKNSISKDWGQEQFFSAGGKKYFDLILEDQNRITGTATHPSDFTQARTDRPFFIAGSTLMTYRSADPQLFLPVEITPFYVGVPVKAKMIEQSVVIDDKYLDEKNSRLQITEVELGGYVEPLAYDFNPPQKREDGAPNRSSAPKHRQVVKEGFKMHRFSLSDALAATGSAPQQTLHKTGFFKLITGNLGFPEFTHWGVRNKGKAQSPVNTNAKLIESLEHTHGDGGHLDNIGIMPLLARGVENILVFVNTQTAFSANSATGDALQAKIYDNIISFYDLDQQGKYKSIYKNKPHNRIFERPSYIDLIQGFNAQRKQGKPLVYCQKEVTILKNNRYNIAGTGQSGYKPNICWVYLDRTKNWLKQIEQASDQNFKRTQTAIRNQQGEFKHFPHYWTFVDDLPKLTLIDRSNRQVNLLANLTAWTVRESAEVIQQGLDLKLNITPAQQNPSPLLKLCKNTPKNCSQDKKRPHHYKEVIIDKAPIVTHHP